MKVPSYFIESNLSEKQIEADVAAYMGWCTPPDADIPFRLIDVDEQTTGADKRFDVGSVIYMQFKKSNGLRRMKRASVRKNKSKVEEIREFRRESELGDNPSLFFQLRRQAKTATDYQHNILLEYEKPPNCRAVYVSPLILDKKEYSQTLFASHSRFLVDPFLFAGHWRIWHRRWVSHLGAVPFLREHVSIPPHERVATHEHFFAFSENGADVSWHSPEVVSRDPSRLSDFLSKTLSRWLAPDGMIPKAGLEGVLREASNGHREDGAFTGSTPFERIMSHGRWLHKTHGIRQILLLANSAEIA